MTEKYKNILAIAIPYSFLCASLWHLAYWMPFGINPFDYLGVNDIVLSFAKHFAFIIIATSVAFLPALLMDHLIINKFRERIKRRDDLINAGKTLKRGWMETASPFILVSLATACSLAILGIFVFTKVDSKWVDYPFYIGILGAIILTLADVKLDFVSKPKFPIIILTTFVPAMTFSLAYQTSLRVKNNQSFNYMYDKKISSYRLKVLGKLGSNYVLTDLDNKKIYFYPISNKEYWEINKFTRK